MRTIRWEGGVVITIDQSRLPMKLEFLKLKSYTQVAVAIKEMKIRGAPLIGVAAAFGLALTAFHSKTKLRTQLIHKLEQAAETLGSTRPTGVNLSWALDRVIRRACRIRGGVNEVKRAVINEALKIAGEDVQTNLVIGRNGAKLLDDRDVVLTHCNPGSLGTVEHGTALSVIRVAIQSQKRIKVIVTETRPQLQGARLTTFELKQEGIPVTLITDSMVGYVMANHIVDKVIVGADRVLKTGHVINKIGTYTIAVLAKAHNIPFLVATPYSTIDLKTKIADVVIEQRNPSEVLTFLGQRVAPQTTLALNPAFDITPPEYVTAFITEKRILPPSAIS